MGYEDVKDRHCDMGHTQDWEKRCVQLTEELADLQKEYDELLELVERLVNSEALPPQVGYLVVKEVLEQAKAFIKKAKEE
jgi:hypothetical protein